MNTAISGAGYGFRALFGRSSVALIALALAVMIGCVGAHAHATLTGTVPADGAVMSKAPEAITLSFNEAVSPIAATLIVPGGQTLVIDGFTTSGASISVSLPRQLGQGSHALSWRAVSEDGHPISGTTFFVIGTASATPVATLQSQDPLVTGLLWLARLVLFVGLFFGAGGAAFRMLAELPRPAAAIAQGASIAGLVAIPAVLGLQGLDLLGGGLSRLGEGRAWVLGLTSPYGSTLGLACFALVLGLVTLGVGSRPLGKVAASTAIILIGLAISASGHASAADPQWLTRPALFMHVTTIAWWVGALIPLVLLLRQNQRVAAPALIRFSRVIPFAIVPLIASGTIIAIIQLGPPGAPWWSPYGQVLAAKLSLLLVLFAIASWNRWVLTAPAAKGEARALRHMRRGIIAEIVLILAVLGLVSIWRFTPPPRALAAQVVTPVTVELANDSLDVAVLFSSDRIGLVDVAIETRASTPEAPKSVKLSLEPESKVMSPVVRMAEPSPEGGWMIDGLPVPLAGVWSIEVEVRVTDFQLSKVQGTIEFNP